MNKGGLKAYVIWATGAFFFLYQYFVRVIPSVLEKLLGDQLAASAAQIATAVGMYLMIYAPMQLLVGPLFDSMGSRKLFTRNSLLLTLSCLLPMIPFHTLFFLGFGRTIMGFASSFSFVGVMYLCALWFPKKNLGMLSGLTSALGVLGAILAQTSLSWLDTSYNNIWWIAFIFGLFVTIILYISIPTDANPSKQSLSSVFKQCKDRIVLIGKQKITWIIGFITGTLYMPFAVFADLWGIPYFTKICHFSAIEAAQLVAILNLSWALGSPIFGWISDTMKSRKMPLIISGISSAICFSVLILSDNTSFSQMAWLQFILGICCGGQAIGFIACAERNSHEMSASAIAFINMIVMALCGIGQALVGYIIDFCSLSWTMTHAYQYGLFSMIVLLLTSLVVFTLGYKEEKNN